MQGERSEISHGPDQGHRRPESEPVALYCGIPFCVTVCTYCDFNVYARQERLFEPYVQALTREIERVAARVPPPRRCAKSLAFGGGTPSILSVPQIEQIVDVVRAQFAFVPNAEWTLEANPGTVDLEKLRALREMGFNRLSLGVQTFDDSRLKQFNRHHTVQDSYVAFDWARRAGFDNLNLDLLYGLPDQSLAEWDATLKKALALQTEHLSLYGLQIEERTVLHKQIALGRVNPPDADLAAAIYERAIETLDAAGFVHYEISNWAKPGFESRHNLTYWLNEAYLGFGAGAHSSYDGERWENVRHPREYIRRLQNGSEIVAQRTRLLPARQMAETVILGLRLVRGVSFARFRARFEVDAREVFAEPIATLTEWELLAVDSERMWLTPRGRALSNQILWRFLLE